jgi:hypothetical protein
LDCFYQALGCEFAVRAEEVRSVDRGKCAAGAEVEVGDRAVVEADRDQPRDVGGPHAQLVDGQQELLVLVALLAGRAVGRESGDENQRVAADRAADLGTPALSRPQARGIAPHREAGRLQPLLRRVDFG